MATTPPPDSLAALRIPGVLRFSAGRLVSVLASQMVAVAVGWQLYERTGSTLALGLTGLVELVPVILLALPAGHAADRFRRRNVAMLAHAAQGLATAGLAAVSALGGPVWSIYALLFVMGIAGAYRSPSVGAMLPQLVPPEALVNANAWMSSGFELAAMGGPALGGALIALGGSATWAYVLAAAAHLSFVVVLATLPSRPPARAGGEVHWRDLFAGLSFVFRTEAFLAAITLDLFAVLLGGATALLPVYAKDVLAVGPTGLGWLRGAPSVGAFAMALAQTRLPAWRRPGRVLLFVVAGFGVSTIVFGLSRSFPLSFVALMLSGAFDNASVVIRSTLEQVLTPDAMRGRVSAIAYVFIGFSNELGAFESGVTAAAFGPVASVVGGGAGTLLVVGLVALKWRSIARLRPLPELAAEVARASGVEKL